MNLIENIREGLRSIASNRLRTILTSLIIAIGITSLVGILTAIDGLQNSVNTSFAGLGANTFSIVARQDDYRQGGRVRKQDEPIDYFDAVQFKRRFPYGATISVSTVATGAAQAKFGSKKTNPNVQLIGGDPTYLMVKGYTLQTGRNLTQNDTDYGLNVAVIGSEVAGTLFEKKLNPVNQVIRVSGNQYKIVGVLDKKGGFSGGGDDRMILIPLDNARALAGSQRQTFSITASVPTVGDQDEAVGEARGVMRQVRRDPLGQPDSFDIERADDLAKETENITGYLRIGGFGIGFITLLGAAIALLNIMLVSVTERTREIGIRKSLGATPQRIREQFLIEAVVICILGGIGGVVMGLGIGNIIASLVSQGKGGFVVPWVWMGLGLVVCIGVGLFAGIYPAVRASKLDPIEALRYE
ncbi:ABC transporter permease [Spirosoma utsteinense]|uniref:ABC transport system permease protein n=1 Tax=Spirosoma utsteinense TaxID=2585773 RepID=A0ABR6W277_9BACT|nr:ABC transporter permease [Spirosoma utsteinense]MBC3785991.1 putative ABC transport system permease protein [Spirosoma utsteinense]MBC3790689.1 putative ABC transport system permease protein [Spirosoma utsteinense]